MLWVLVSGDRHPEGLNMLKTAIPFDVSLWEATLKTHKKEAKGEKLKAISENKFELWSYLIQGDGCLHPEFSRANATTRLQSRKPNVQGITKALRGCVNSPGKMIIWSDWKSSHPTILAQASKDAQMIEDLQGVGVYEAHEAYGTVKEIKLAVLILLNGGSPEELQRKTGIQDPRGFTEHWAKRYPQAEAFIKDLKRTVAKSGSFDLGGESVHVDAPYKAFAHYCQRVEVERLLGVMGTKAPKGLELIIPLHDETVWVSDASQAPENAAWVQEQMNRAIGPEGSASVALGPRWGIEGTEPEPPRPSYRSEYIQIAEELIEGFVENPRQSAWSKDPVSRVSLSLYAVEDPEEYACKLADLSAEGGSRPLVSSLKALGKKARKQSEHAQNYVSKGEVDNSGLPVFEKGSQVEIGRHLIETFAPQGDLAVQELMASGDEVKKVLRIYDRLVGAWRVLHRSRLEGASLRYDYAFKKTSKGAAPIILSDGACDGIVNSAIKHINASYEGVWEEAPRDYVAFKNGVLFEGGSFESHERAHNLVAENVLDYDRDLSAECPRWIQFMGEIFEGDEDAEDKIAFLQQYAGAAIFGKTTQHQKHPLCVGDGSNGKSVHMEIMASMFPTYSASQPASWGGRFGISTLFRSMANFVAELSSARLSDTDLVKAVLTGDVVSAEFKNETAFRYRPQGAHFLYCNEIPATNDRSDGFFRRMVVIEFNRRFSGDSRDHDLVAKLKKEIPGVIEWAIRGYAALAANHFEYVDPQSSVEAGKRWREDSATEIAFTASDIERSEDVTTTHNLYRAYRSWCEDTGVHPVKLHTFGKALKRAGFEQGRRKKQRGWYARVKDECTEAARNGVPSVRRALKATA